MQSGVVHLGTFNIRQVYPHGEYSPGRSVVHPETFIQEI